MKQLNKEELSKFGLYYDVIGVYMNLKPIGTSHKKLGDKGFFSSRDSSDSFSHESVTFLVDGDYYERGIKDLNKYMVDNSEYFEYFVFDDNAELLWWLSK